MKRENLYSSIKLDYFESALDFCRFQFDDGLVKSWKYDGSEYGFAIDSISGFNHPLEQLMFMVIIAIENAGRHVPTHKWALENIKNIINDNTLNVLINYLTPEERQYEDEGYGFLYDLNLVLDNQKLERE